MQAAGGRSRLSISPSCVEYINAPLGLRMANGEEGGGGNLAIGHR